MGLLDALEGGHDLLGEHILPSLLHGHEGVVGRDGGVDVRPLCDSHIAPDAQVPWPGLEGEPVLGQYGCPEDIGHLHLGVHVLAGQANPKVIETSPFRPHLQHDLHHCASSCSWPRGLEYVGFEYVVFSRWELHLGVEEFR